MENFLREIKTRIMPVAIINANLTVEHEIVGGTIWNAFPVNCLKKTFRELCETEIQGRYDWDKNKIENRWCFPAFDFGDIVDSLIEESLENDLHDFVDDCVKNGKYKQLMEKYKIPNSDDDFYRDFVTDLVADVHYEDEIFLTRENIELWTMNPTVKKICRKYAEQVDNYQRAWDEYWRKHDEWYKKQLNLAEKIPAPNIDQKITKNDKDLLKYLKENYSPQEIRLLIFAKKLKVSNKVGMMFPESLIEFPKSSPSLTDFLNDTRK